MKQFVVNHFYQFEGAIADGYAAMDERRTIKALDKVSNLKEES